MSDALRYRRACGGPANSGKKLESGGLERLRIIVSGTGQAQDNVGELEPGGLDRCRVGADISSNGLPRLVEGLVDGV